MVEVSLKKKIFMSLLVCACICVVFGVAAWADGPAATVRQLTYHANYDSNHGDWSPDGRSVVFQRRTSDRDYGAIFRIGSDGTKELQITSGYRCDSKPRFSPDGMSIAFQRYDEPAGQSEGWDNKASIWVMNADGSNQRKVVDYLPDSQGGAQWPSWSPDGKFIAFWYGNSSEKGVSIVKLLAKGTAGPVQNLPTLTGYRPHMFIEWRPGRSGLQSQILANFRNQAEPYGRQIALISLGTPPRAQWLTSDGDCHVYQEWSPDGRKIVFTDDENNCSDIWLMKANGANKLPLTDCYSASRCYTSPTWSPNGRYIAYWSSNRDDGDSGTINIMTSDGRHSLPLTDDETLRDTGDSRFTLSFNRQGTMILFQGQASGLDQLFVLDLNVSDDDSDGLLNWEEDVWTTSRTNPDTDGGGVSDGAEVARGTDPLRPGDDY